MFDSVLNMRWVLNMTWFWKCQDSKYVRVLNMLLVLGFLFPENQGFLRKYKKLFQRKFFTKNIGGLFLRKYKKAFFWANIRIFLIIESESYISWNIRNFFRGWIFLSFSSFGSKCGGLPWENIRIFLILELESSISRNIRNFFRGGCFEFFWAWAEKCAR